MGRGRKVPELISTTVFAHCKTCKHNVVKKMEKYGIILKTLNLHQTCLCFLRVGGKKKKNFQPNYYYLKVNKMVSLLTVPHKGLNFQ